MLKQLTRFASLFNSHIVEQAKIVEYADTGLRMAYRNEWVISGMMLSHFTSSFINFFVLYARAAQVTDTTTV